jgi:hypothetical protein
MFEAIAIYKTFGLEISQFEKSPFCRLALTGVWWAKYSINTRIKSIQN